jgi:hypothetical protein
MVEGLIQNGVMPLYTPLGGSWLNMAEPMQRILKGRAWDGQHPKTPELAELQGSPWIHS